MERQVRFDLMFPQLMEHLPTEQALCVKHFAPRHWWITAGLTADIVSVVVNAQDADLFRLSVEAFVRDMNSQFNLVGIQVFETSGWGGFNQERN